MTDPQQQQCLPQLPRECFEAIVTRLPPNCIPLAIRPLSMELRQRYHSHTRVAATGAIYVPEWALAAAAAHVSKYELMKALARRGYLEAMRQLAEQHPASQLVDSSTLYQAARGGHLDVVRWLVEDNGCHDDSYGAGSCACAAAYGHLHVLQYLVVTQRPPFVCGVAVWLAAARGGHAATLQWLRQNGCDWTSDVAAAAAGAGQLSALRWLIEQGCALGAGNGQDCALRAAFNGHVDVLEFLKQHNCVWSADMAEHAALAGELQALQWLRGKGCPWDTRCWKAAAVNGHLAVLEFLLAGKCPRDQDSRSLVEQLINSWQPARAKALRWLGEHGWPMSIGVCIVAAQQGDLAMLQWLRELQPPCPWNENVADAAARRQHVECLQWLLHNGCPWSEGVYRLVRQTPALSGVRFPGLHSGRQQAA